MKKWIFIGLGGLIVAMVIDGIRYYLKERAKMDDKFEKILDEAVNDMKQKDEEFERNCDRICQEMAKETEQMRIAKTMDHISDEVAKASGKDPETILKDIILENGETAQEWIDRVLSMDRDTINLELKIDP